MDRLFQECYTSRLGETGYILPFFWQHGESHARLAEEMEAIRRAGVTEFCVESRTHPEFGQEKWYEDFAFILEYARQNGMRVWLLDDKNFPTGYANGVVATLPQNSPLRRKIVRLEYRDFVGPTRCTRIPAVPLKDRETFIAISAFLREGEGFSGEPILLNAALDTDGWLNFDLPQGLWRIFYVIASPHVCFRGDYIDMLNPDSCKLLLDTVYQPHYDRFKDYFGNTFRGFFSDEPGFQTGHGSYCISVGTEGAELPWRADLPTLLAEKIGRSDEEILAYLPALWQTLPAFGPAVRHRYMDVITGLYRDNFSKMLGNWCREKKVLYIGHIIEDNGCHQRLGQGAGHFFRALEGQDMSGADIVLHQMLPKNTEAVTRAPLYGGFANPRFFYYMLGKLAASAAHLYPHMENRAMIELFGAFGFGAGVGHMKYMADHFLASGLNHFVPHAYSPKYPDPDCPPHFHCGGRNPQEEAFGDLLRYMQKIARLTSDTVHKADVALFYNADGEWAGGKISPCEALCTILTQNQIDFDIVPHDLLKEAEISDGKLAINGETYGALVVPYCETLPSEILATFARLQQEGLAVIFESAPPKWAAEGFEADEVLTQSVSVLPEVLPQVLRNMGCFHVTAKTSEPYLRSYRVDRGDTTVYLLFNEGGTEIDTAVTFEGIATPVFFDVWNNKVTKPQFDGCTVRIKLASGEATVLLGGDGRDALPHRYDIPTLTEIPAKWQIFLQNAGEEAWEDWGETENLPPFNTPQNHPAFCGTLRYETSFSATGEEVLLDLGAVGEIATVRVNGRRCGRRVASPYRFDIKKAIHPGENTLTVEVVNSPAYREIAFDKYSNYLPISAGGLLGPVKLG